MRLVGTSMDCYNYLEPLYNDYRKIRRKNKMGSKFFNPYLSNYPHRKVLFRCAVLLHTLLEVSASQMRYNRKVGKISECYWGSDVWDLAAILK